MLDNKIILWSKRQKNKRVNNTKPHYSFLLAAITIFTYFLVSTNWFLTPINDGSFFAFIAKLKGNGTFGKKNFLIFHCVNGAMKIAKHALTHTHTTIINLCSIESLSSWLLYVQFCPISFNIWFLIQSHSSYIYHTDKFLNANHVLSILNQAFHIHDFSTCSYSCYCTDAKQMGQCMTLWSTMQWRNFEVWFFSSWDSKIL